ncbi:MAG: hypothetical protein H6696_20425 [Deferribacteres bacterium]|nr:hypothetical protein [candidate division KSB1 bacterium]MCB9504298.1 hypothetical protein [Deferribacteres bacterium]
MNIQFITNEAGKKVSVILPMAEYIKMREALEELEDIKSYDAVKARKEETVPLDDYLEVRENSQNE